MKLVRSFAVTACWFAALPVGLAAENTREVDLYLVAGQSNAVGFDAKPSDLPASELDDKVLFWFKVGDPPPDDGDSTSGDAWTTLKPQPLGSPKPKDSQPRQYGNFAQSEGGFGPEIGIARTILTKNPDTDLAIFKVAFSGTSLIADWAADAACWTSFASQYEKAIAAAEANGIALRPKGFVWVQGESDATPERAAAYADALAGLIARVRELTGEPRLIARVGFNTKFGHGKKELVPQVVDAQRLAAARDPLTDYVDTSEATIANAAHYDTAGTLYVGELFGKALLPALPIYRSNGLPYGLDKYWGEADAAARMRAMATLHSNESEWSARAEMIRESIREIVGLDKRPEPCDLAPIRHSKRMMDGYSVENVAIQSLPGYWMTGNLYLPGDYSEDAVPDAYGVMLAPHGHREFKRVYEDTQKRCANMARMGAIAFTWDMVGYGENEPCAHRFHGAFELQTHNSTRALDFVLSLAGADEDRVSVSGGSGGGTQSFILSAVDDRVDVSAPVVMVSAHFFGGCVCESGTPIHFTDKYMTNNVEIAALHAPKPQLLVSVGGDWTSNTPDVEMPYLKHVYGHFGAAENIENAHFAEEVHDYGPSKRTAVLEFLARRLNLDKSQAFDADGKLDESHVTVLEKEDLLVFGDGHPRPEGSVSSCEAVLQLLSGSSKNP